MVTDSRRHVDELLSEVKPLLKREGFRKTRLDWVRERGDAIQCVSIQMMRGGWAFFFNLGVIWPRSFELLGWERFPLKHYTATYAPGAVRLNQLSDAPRDESASGLALQMELYGLPWLEKSLDPRTFVEQSACGWRVAFYVLAGDVEAAQSVVASDRAILEAETDPRNREMWVRCVANSLAVLQRAGIQPP